MPNYSIGLQMYTLRDLTSQDFVGTLRKVADLGYQGVEFAGYGGMEANELRALLDELGLAAIGSHTGYERMLEAADEEIQYMKTIGGRYIAVPYLDTKYRTAEAWKEVCRNLAELGKRCQAEGIHLLYHNHQFEFTEHLDGKPLLDVMFESVSPDLLQMELDGCWAYAAGYDPNAYIQKYQGRLPLLHFKDYRPTASGPLTVELGAGIVPLQSLAQTAEEAGIEWLIVEQDVLTNPPIESVTTSYKWIQTNLL